MTAECCDGCDGSGVRFPASPSCRFDESLAGWEFFERCDACGRLESDLAAALSISSLARVVRCCNGGEHVVIPARDPMRPTITDWDPDIAGPNPVAPAQPTPAYALKFLLCSLRVEHQLGRDLSGWRTVEYVARKALGQHDPCPRYAR